MGTSDSLPNSLLVESMYRFSLEECACSQVLDIAAPVFESNLYDCLSDH